MERLLLLVALAGPAFAQRGAVEMPRYRTLAEVGLRAPSTLAPVPLAHVPRAQPGAARPTVLLTGYWPPSNEAIRPFSTNAAQNPGGWIGSNWQGRGYDVHAFFPEFADPSCSDCGQGMGDMEVDYQDTSLDFWTYADQLEPIAIITFSRGLPGEMAWEVELNQFNRDSWLPDFTAPKQPTPSPPNANEPANALLTSSLPLQHVVDKIHAEHPALEPWVCASGDGGGYLSEFAAYHGVWYQAEHADPLAPDWCVAAGHIHVGGAVDWPLAQAATETTLHAVLDHVDAIVDPGPCSTDLGFAGPGSASLELCGALASNGSGTLWIEGPADKTGWLFVSTSFTPIPVGAGTLIAAPPILIDVLSVGPAGSFAWYGVPGGGGPLTLYAQYLYLDTALPNFLGISNAIEVTVLP